MAITSKMLGARGRRQAQKHTTHVTPDAVTQGEVLVAHTYAGKPLEPDRGAPLRLLVPKRYFWRSAKFLRRLEMMSGDRMGFWGLNGYQNDADPWQEQRHWF
jgi:DMSO/TMAO reductase YedYZ molybdopterin-dependent catalytic subunit